MKILIFGGSGVISGYLPEAAMKKGYDVTCVCRGNKNQYIPTGVEILHADCNDERQIRAAFQGRSFDVVVDFLSFFKCDIERKLKELNGKVKQYIFISSACVYTSENPNRRFVESDDKNNMWDYAIGKMECEEYLSKFCRNTEMTYTIVRPPITYGIQRVPFQINSFANSYSLILRMKAGDPVLMAGDGGHYHTFTHSWDFCRVLTEMFLNEAAYKEDVHITSGISYTWNDVLEYISQSVQIKPKVIYLPAEEIERSSLFKGSMFGDKARNMLFDNSKMYSFIKKPYRFSITLEEGIRKTIDYMERHRQFQKIDTYWNEEINRLIGYRKKSQVVAKQLNKEDHVYYLEWNGRYSQDFVYAFDKIISIAGYVSLGEKKRETYLNKKIYTLDEIKICGEVQHKVIICRNPDECQEEEIERFGIRYGKDWKYAEDMLELLDQSQLDLYIKRRKVILWGAGVMARKFLMMYPFIAPDLLIDRDKEKQGTYLLENEIRPIDELKKVCKEESYVIVAAPYEEVKKELESMGWQEGKNFVDISTFWIYPSEMMRKILRAPTITTWQCHNPFEHVRIMDNGNFTYCYCADSSQVNIGKIPFLQFNEYKESCLLRLIRLSMLNGTYVFCNKKYCSMLRKQTKNKKIIQNDLDYSILIPEDFRLVTDINIDESCNLYCASCRGKVIYNKNEQKQKLTECVINQVLPETEILFLAGNGEVFASTYYKEVLHAKKFKKLQGIMILSNGNICKKEEWNYITDLVNGNVHVSISVDASNEKTYCKLRRGGNFKRVEENIRYICSLKQMSRVKCVVLNFVIQKENYLELEEFVLWGKALGADYFNITFLDNWGTWSEDEFQKICMYETKERVFPELQKELDKLQKYKGCIFLDDAYYYRQKAYAILRLFNEDHNTLKISRE